MTCFFRHHWITAAFDEYKVKDAGYNHKKRLVRFCYCARCQKRKTFRAGLRGRRAPHALHIVAAAWEDHNYILIKSDGRVIDDEYAKSTKGTQRYDYRPLNGIEEIVAAIRSDPKFKKVSNHQMVADAMEELETVIKMHENLEMPE